jgi:hypothetical protein
VDVGFGGSIGLVPGGPVNNGGATPTIALVSSSPAIDLVPAAQCGPAEGQDQRGFFRPSGAGCDAGAYERVICNGVVQEGPAAVDCPPPPVAGQPTPTTAKKKRCKKKKKKKPASAAAKKKKCKKKKKKR